MTEEEAKSWLQTKFDVPRETWTRLEGYVSLLLEASAGQNLIAASTIPNIWARHIVDSAQLLRLTKDVKDGMWVDLGAGAGLPAIVIACLSPRPMLMIETRRKRVNFLNDVIAHLGLGHAQVFGGRVEAAPAMQAAVISARAYAPLPKLLESAVHLADKNSCWVLPKGRSAENELEAVRGSWQGVFHVEPSVTDQHSAIIVAHGVHPVGKGKHRP